MRLKIVALGAITGIVLIMNGCSSKTMQATNSGFFDDYKQFENVEIQKPNLKKYTKIIVMPVEVISVNLEESRTPKQQELYDDISLYLYTSYKKDLQESGSYELVDKKSSNTLILQTAISTVEVHTEDKNWNQLSPISLDLNVVSYNAYMDEDVRVLGEVKLIDAQSGDVIFRGLNIQKNDKILISGEYLTIEDIKNGLDSWLEQIRNDLQK